MISDEDVQRIEHEMQREMSCGLHLARTQKIVDVLAIIERMRAAEAKATAMEKVVRKALRDSGCDGDLCMYQWHEDARVALANADNAALAARAETAEGKGAV